MTTPRTKRPSVSELLSAQYWDNLASRDNGRGDSLGHKIATGAIITSFALAGNVAPLIMHVASRPPKFTVWLGMRSKHIVEDILPFHYPFAVVAVANALLHSKRKISRISDTDSGAEFEAELGQDWASFPGTLLLELVDTESSHTRVVGTSIVKGQLTDYGKGRKALESLIATAKTVLR